MSIGNEASWSRTVHWVKRPTKRPLATISPGGDEFCVPIQTVTHQNGSVPAIVCVRFSRTERSSGSAYITAGQAPFVRRIPVVGRLPGRRPEFDDALADAFLFVGNDFYLFHDNLLYVKSPSVELLYNRKNRWHVLQYNHVFMQIKSHPQRTGVVHFRTDTTQCRRSRTIVGESGIKIGLTSQGAF
jgi:hypothetical protein